MFNRTIALRVVKKNGKDEEDPTMQEVLEEIKKTETQQAVKAVVNFVGLQALKWVAITTVISTAAKVAENRLSK